MPVSRPSATPTPATSTWPGKGLGVGDAVVQSVRLDAQPDGVRRRAAPDLRIGSARGGRPEHAEPRLEPGQDRAGDDDLPAVPVLQRLLRPDARALEPRADRPSA